MTGYCWMKSVQMPINSYNASKRAIRGMLAKVGKSHVPNHMISLLLQCRELGLRH